MTTSYTEEEKIKIQRLGGKGFPDTVISRLLNKKIHVIKPITKAYWEQKMKNKHES